MKGRHTETEILSPVTLLMDVKVGGIQMPLFIDLQLCNSLNNGTQGKICFAFSRFKLIMHHWYDKRQKVNICNCQSNKKNNNKIKNSIVVQYKRVKLEN